MLLVRLPGQHSVRQALAELAPAKKPDPGRPQVMQVEVVVESDPGGGLHVHSPNFGVRFEEYMQAIEAVVPPGGMRHISESSLSLLSEPHLKRLRANGFEEPAPMLDDLRRLAV